MQVGQAEIAILRLYLASMPPVDDDNDDDDVNAATGRCCQHGWRWTTATVPQVMTLISLVIYCGYAGIRPPSATHDNQSPSPWFNSARPTKRALTLQTTEQNRIVRTGKSEAEVTNNKKMRSRCCTIKATKLTTDINEASRGLFATAELLLKFVFKFVNKL